MSKKNLFMGSMALFIVMTLALIGCRGAGDSLPVSPTISVKSVALGTDAVMVTFSDTLQNVNKAFGPGYTDNKANYTVNKKTGTTANPLTIETLKAGSDNKSVIIGINGIHKDIKADDTIEAGIKAAKLATYMPKPLVAVSAAALSATEIRITFSDGIAANDALKDLFVVKGKDVTFTVSKMSLATDNFTVLVLEASGATGITDAVKDLTVTCNNADKKLTGVNSLPVNEFAGLKVDTAKVGKTEPPVQSNPGTPGTPGGSGGSGTPGTSTEPAQPTQPANPEPGTGGGTGGGAGGGSSTAPSA
jgi:hypothetical protein